MDDSKRGPPVLGRALLQRSGPPLSAVSCSHSGDAVRVGQYTMFAGGAQYGMEPSRLKEMDVLIPLTRLSHEALRYLVSFVEVRYHPLEDFGGVSDDWPEFMQGVARDVREKKRVLAFCIAGHGRTGTLLASLIALLEPECEDPIAAVRERYCPHAVETREQAEAIFALKGVPLPVKYHSLALRVL